MLSRVADALYWMGRYLERSENLTRLLLVTEEVFDPTHHRVVDERYVVVGHGRHYDDVPPNKGIFRGNAREALRAEVRTRPSAPKAVAALQEEVEHIDLPVFQEIPARSHDWASAVAEDAVAQRQEQQ